MDKPLYDVICEALVDGRLPEDFRLPIENSRDESFADGALDGIMVYHGNPGAHLTEDQEALIIDAVETISAGDFYAAEELLWRVADEIGALDAHAALQNAIDSRMDALNPGNLFNFAVTVAIQSDRRALVKLALTIIGAFIPDDTVKDFVRTLGLSDEFTLFAAAAMCGWDDANEAWFSLARKVRGWGRIHLVARIRPETAAIRRWLLREGVHNDILPAYSALQCWKKADVPAVLRANVDRADFVGARDIIDALLDEGPVAGISAVEGAEEHMRAFLKAAEMTALDDADRAVIARIWERFDGCAQIVEACDDLLS